MPREKQVSVSLVIPAPDEGSKPAMERIVFSAVASKEVKIYHISRKEGYEKRDWKDNAGFVPVGAARLPLHGPRKSLWPCDDDGMAGIARQNCRPMRPSSTFITRLSGGALTSNAHDMGR